MIIHHSNEFGSLSEQQLSELESQLGSKFPSDYREFLLTHNGGRPEPGAFFVESIGECVVSIFSGIHGGPDYAQLIPAITGYGERLPSNMVPIGNDEIGNVLCIPLNGEDKGSVYLGELHRDLYSDHPFEQDVLYKLAKSFTAFLNSLVPASPPIEYVPTALEKIAQAGDKEVLLSVVAQHGPNAHDEIGRPIIQLAAHYGQLELIQLLVDQGANPAGLISIAAMRGNEALFDYAITIGADLEERSIDTMKATPLIIASMEGYIRIVRKLLAKGANVNATNSAGITAKVWARRKGFIEIETLLETASHQSQ